MPYDYKAFTFNKISKDHFYSLQQMRCACCPKLVCITEGYRLSLSLLTFPNTYIYDKQLRESIREHHLHWVVLSCIQLYLGWLFKRADRKARKFRRKEMPLAEESQKHWSSQYIKMAIFGILEVTFHSFERNSKI